MEEGYPTAIVDIIAEIIVKGHALTNVREMRYT